MQPHLYSALLVVPEWTSFAGSVAPHARLCLVNGMHLRVTGLACRRVGSPRVDDRKLLFFGASAPCPLLRASTACANDLPLSFVTPGVTPFDARPRLAPSMREIVGCVTLLLPADMLDARRTCRTRWGLTFDMRGGRQLAKPDVARPLDGRVSHQLVACTTDGCLDELLRARPLDALNRDAIALVFPHCSLFQSGPYSPAVWHRSTAHQTLLREWHAPARDLLACRRVDSPRVDDRKLLFLGASAPCLCFEPQQHMRTARRSWLATSARPLLRDS